MKRTPRYILGALVALALVGPAAAQQTFRQVSGAVYDIWPKNPTYHAAFTVTPAAAATDVATIQASAGKNVRLNRAMCTGFATTAGFVNLQLVARSTLDVGGTSTTVTPVTATQSDAASAAVIRVYTANPTALGTTVGVARSAFLAMPTASSGYGPIPVDWPFGLVYSTKRVDAVKNTTQNLALSLAGGAVPAGGQLACSLDWSED